VISAHVIDDSQQHAVDGRALVSPDNEEALQFAIRVQGMTCGGCVNSVTNAIESSSTHVQDVKVDLASGYAFVAVNKPASWPNDHDKNEAEAKAVKIVVDAIEDIGFDAELDVSSLGDTIELRHTDIISVEERGGHGGESNEDEEEQTIATIEKECGICLDPLEQPIHLPCGHAFSAKCLNAWRSKYDAMQIEERTCPLCRKRMPPSKEMISQLISWKRAVAACEKEGDNQSREYFLAKATLQKLEASIGEGGEYSLIDINAEELDIELPDIIAKDAMRNNAKTVLQWIGPFPRTSCTQVNAGDGMVAYKKRLDAQNQTMMEITMLHAAAVNGHVDLTKMLLQLGASVDVVDANGYSPLKVKTFTESQDSKRDMRTIRTLLEWGAHVPTKHHERMQFIREARQYGKCTLASLLQSDLGGRRCEVVNMSNSKLNGKTCVVDKYLPDKKKYKARFEYTKQVYLVDPIYLKSCNRTPDNPGDSYVTFDKKNGRIVLHEFASKGECVEFLESLRREIVDEGEVAKEMIIEAGTQADLVAQELLAELDLEERGSSSSKLKSKKSMCRTKVKKKNNGK